jgi:3-hydroxybutyryl-CoA dehydratase
MNVKISDTYSISMVVTKEMVAYYASVSGDHNPIHLRKEAAISAGFQREIVHGMLTMGISTKMFQPYIEEGYLIVAHSTRFKAPLLVDGELTLESKVENVRNETIELRIVGYASNLEVIVGKAKLMKNGL